uniref:HAUS augmin-like complex subunit 2 n=1 Tax=Gadus morhua TaxID=8049 RepID=A0A8C4Z4H3_GADMO
MDPWERSPFSITPAGSFLSSCVAKGIWTQEEFDSAPRESHAFSPRLQAAEQHIRAKRELAQLRLEAELLSLEKESADVTHKFYLTRRFRDLQVFASHLQDLLKEQSSLSQRLMKPFCQTSLPMEAHLHRYVVELIQMVLDFIESLERHVTTLRALPSLPDSVAKLNSGVAQLLAQVAEVEQLSSQMLDTSSFSLSRTNSITVG